MGTIIGALLSVASSRDTRLNKLVEECSEKLKINPKTYLFLLK
jgi:hypothetical protein